VAEQVTVLFRHPGPVSRGTSKEVLQVCGQVEGITIRLVGDPRKALQRGHVLLTALPNLHRAMFAPAKRCPGL
jgi:hypothetical protein